VNFRLLPARWSQEAIQATQAFVCRRESPPQMGLFRELSHGHGTGSTAYIVSTLWAAFDAIIKLNLSY